MSVLDDTVWNPDVWKAVWKAVWGQSNPWTVQSNSTDTWTVQT